MASFTNPFEVLNEEEDGVIRVSKVQPKKEEPVSKPASKAPAKEQAKTQPKKVDSSDNKDARPQRNFDRPQGERRPRREERGEEPSEGKGAVAAGSPNQERPFRPRGDRPAGERRERRDREGEGAGAPRQRVYDRRSGTGRGHENKRGGAGRGNWGSLNDEDQGVPSGERKAESVAVGEEVVEESVATEATEGEQAAAEPAAPRELTPEEQARQAEREKEEKLMTLDEYLKVKKGVNVPLPEQRKAGEGEDASQWAEFIAARSDKDAAEERKPTKAVKQQEKKTTKAAVDPALLRFRSETPRRDQDRDSRRERGPRREGGRPQQAQRSAQQAAYSIESGDFPALKA